MRDRGANGMVERNAGLPPDDASSFASASIRGCGRGGDGDLMGTASIWLPGWKASPRRDLSVGGRLPAGQGAARFRGRTITAHRAQEHRRADPSRFARCRRPRPGEDQPPQPPEKLRRRRASRSSSCPSPISAVSRTGAFRRRGLREPHDRSFAHSQRLRRRPQYGVHLQRQAARRRNDRPRAERPSCPRRQRSARRTRMRVNVQLHRRGTGNHLWAERFDKPLADLFDMQAKSSRAWQARSTPTRRRRGARAEQAPNPTRWTFFSRLACSIRLIPLTIWRERAFFRSGALRRSRQCRRSHSIGALGHYRGRIFL